MIVTRAGADLRLITQVDHARVAAEILSLWRADGLPAHPRRDDLLFAVREHDNGWQETDAAPHLNPVTGGPYSFLDLPENHRRELWDRGTLRHAVHRPASAPLITLHALRLHEDRRSDESWSTLLAELAERLVEQTEVAALEAADLEADYIWLRLADGISLRACGALGDEFETSGRRVRRTGDELAVDPFPLAGATTFSIPCRFIRDRRYDSDTDLAVDLATARWTDFKVRLVPQE